MYKNACRNYNKLDHKIREQKASKHKVMNIKPAFGSKSSRELIHDKELAEYRLKMKEELDARQNRM